MKRLVFLSLVAVLLLFGCTPEMEEAISGDTGAEVDTAADEAEQTAEALAEPTVEAIEEPEEEDTEETPVAETEETPVTDAEETPVAEVDETPVTLAEETPVDEAGATVAVRSKEGLGEFLVDAEGMSLYLFLADEQGANSSACYDDCAQAWPPLIAEGEPTAEDAAIDASLLDTFEREDGSMQVTYNGWPLYYFAPDEQPGDTMGHTVEGFGAEWYLLTPEGEQLESESE